MDLTTISAAAAALSVIVAVAYAIFQLRDANRARHTRLIIQLNPALNLDAAELVDDLAEVMALEYEDFESYRQARGELFADKAIYSVTEYYNGLGFLLHRRLVDLEEVDYLLSGTVARIWEQLAPIIRGARESYEFPQLCEWFEYLYERTREREGQAPRRP
jgi:hypothetical protein